MPRPSKPILSRRGIAEAALALVDEEGIQALTTRRLAQRLGVEGPSLYNHISSRDDLIDEITALIVEDIDVAALDAPDWRTGLVELAHSYRRAFARHPNIVNVVLQRPARTQNAFEGYDRLLRLLVESGWDSETAGAITAALDHLVLGSIVVSFAQGFERPPEEYSDYPHLAETLRSIDGTPVDERGFELGLAALTSHLDQLRREATD
jgi:AcrR family transcriptional regulator